MPRCVYYRFLHHSLISSVDFRTNVTTFLSCSHQLFPQGNSISQIGGGQLFFGLMAHRRPESEPDESNLKGPHFAH